jgi:hypothetical protein
MVDIPVVSYILHSSKGGGGVWLAEELGRMEKNRVPAEEESHSHATSLLFH